MEVSNVIEVPKCNECARCKKGVGFENKKMVLKRTIGEEEGLN